MFLLPGLEACRPQQEKKEASAPADTVIQTVAAPVSLPAPYATKSVKKYCRVTGWPENKTPQAPEGFVVTKYADGLRNPRWIYVAPNGDVLVAEANTESKGVKKIAAEVTGKMKSQNMGESANRIKLFRDKDQDGKPELQQVLLSGLKRESVNG